MADPSEKIPRPKKPNRLARSIMEQKEVEQLMTLPDVRTLRGYRNRVILEVLYSTALRREEVTNLTIADVDTDGGYVFVREGKGGKDRVVPLGRNVCDLVKSYLQGVRPDWINADKDKHLFLNRWGRAMHPNGVWAVVRRYVTLAGIDRQVSPTRSAIRARRTCCATARRSGNCRRCWDMRPWRRPSSTRG